MSAEHTPGDWRVLSADRSEHNESKAQEMAGCIVEGDIVVAYLPNHLKRADILAAAPELLAALEMALESLEAVGLPQEWNCLPVVTAAIAKARGQA